MGACAALPVLLGAVSCAATAGTATFVGPSSGRAGLHSSAALRACPSSDDLVRFRWAFWDGTQGWVAPQTTATLGYQAFGTPPDMAAGWHELQKVTPAADGHWATVSGVVSSTTPVGSVVTVDVTCLPTTPVGVDQPKFGYYYQQVTVPVVAA